MCKPAARKRRSKNMLVLMIYRVRRNRYLLPLKCLFCYAEKSGLKDIMKMEKAQEQEYSLMLKREYGNPCSSPKKFILFCRKLLFLESKNINWEANVWFTGEYEKKSVN